MQPYEVLKNLVYALVFGFIGVILGIWTADNLSTLLLKNSEPAFTRTFSLIIIVLIIAAGSFIGFTKGKTLLE